MTITHNNIDNLQSHWAFSKICKGDQQEITRRVKQKLAEKSIGNLFKFDFAQIDNDPKLLERARISYEFAIVEGLAELSKRTRGDRELIDMAVAGSFMAYDIQSLDPIPAEIDERLFFVLKLSAQAYCGDRWSDLRRWYKENKSALEVPNLAGLSWEKRLLYSVFDCWIRLFRKDGWKDLNEVGEIVSRLRREQKEFESGYLNSADELENGTNSFRLIALYNFAKSTEVVAEYVLNGKVNLVDGETSSPFPSIDKHFDAAIQAADSIGEAQFVLLLRYLNAVARIMVNNSLWRVAQKVIPKTMDFVKSLVNREDHAMFELLPPQRAALHEQELLNPIKTAIVIDLPTSGGKTLLAEFRILQALSQYQNDRGWVAYVVPTRALSAQIYRRLKKDLSPIGIRVEQLTASVEVDTFEEKMLAESEDAFDILVATPEKLALLIKNNLFNQRPLALAVVDEAHNIESSGRGMRIEFLLATIKRDCPSANFLLMLPNAAEIEPLVKWLSEDSYAGQTISLGTTPWRPNERIVGLFSTVEDTKSKKDWQLQFEILTATEKAMPLSGKHLVGNPNPINVPKSKVFSKGRQNGLAKQTVAIAKEMSARGTSIAVARDINTVWKMADNACDSLPDQKKIPPDIKVVQDFLHDEFGAEFRLIDLLAKRVGVHHAGLSDDVRTLMEWLAENGSLKILCATTTIAQGLNFPVASVFMQTHKFQYGKEMTPREFWNLAGRAGRINHDSVGVVGIAAGNDPAAVKNFVSRQTGELVSQLVAQLDELETQGKLADLSDELWKEQWEDFRCYIAHLWAQKKNLDAVLYDAEEFLQQTFGYMTLRDNVAYSRKADALLDATLKYARKLADMPPGTAELSDSTGFSPEGVRAAMARIGDFDPKLTLDDWNVKKLFSANGKMADLYSVMLKVPQLNSQLSEIGGKGFEKSRLANITLDWINGKSINTIAANYFSDPNKNEDATTVITNTCKAIYRTIVNNGSWGLSALSRCVGLNFDGMQESERNMINMLPAMIYHGVNTEEAVLMRMNSVPRSIAPQLGRLFAEKAKRYSFDYNPGSARKFLKSMDEGNWQEVCPNESRMNGQEYKQIWQLLAGEAA